MNPLHSTEAKQTGTLHSAGQQRSFQRVAVCLQGRLMLTNLEEHICQVVEMSPGDACFTCACVPHENERVIAYIDQVGRVEGSVIELTKGGFVMSIDATMRKREKLAAQLTWIVNKHELGLPEDRRHDRLTPRQTRTELTLADGKTYPCHLFDFSRSGAAVNIRVRPAIGSVVLLGNMHARVVRHFLEGVAIEFLSLRSLEDLAVFIGGTDDPP